MKLSCSVMIFYKQAEYTSIKHAKEKKRHSQSFWGPKNIAAKRFYF